MKLAFRRRAFAEETRDQLRSAAHLVSQRQPDSDGQATSNNGITAIEMCIRIEDVHGTATAAAATTYFAEQLSHDGVHRHAARQCMAMFAIRRDDGIVRMQRLHHAHRDSLFAII
jgi:hypothetical protein